MRYWSLGLLLLYRDGGCRCWRLRQSSSRVGRSDDFGRFFNFDGQFRGSSDSSCIHHTRLSWVGWGRLRMTFRCRLFWSTNLELDHSWLWSRFFHCELWRELVYESVVEELQAVSDQNPSAMHKRT